MSDLPLPKLIDHFHQHQPTGLFVSVRPSQSFHVVDMEGDGHVTEILDVGRSNIWINGGYFVLNTEIFDHLHKGEELVLEPFHRLIQQRQLMTYRYEGFWACLDTFKEKQRLEEMYSQGNAPWEVWRGDGQVNAVPLTMQNGNAEPLPNRLQARPA